MKSTAKKVPFLPEKRQVYIFVIFILFLLKAACAIAATPAGYSEYYIPGDEEDMWFIFNELDYHPNYGDTFNDYMHAIISVTAWADNTTVYYDNWENSVHFDPDNPGANIGGTGTTTPIGPLTSIEKYTLNAGQKIVFTDNSNPGIPYDHTSSSVYYDGGDHIYVVGGTATVTRTSWNAGLGPVLCAAWEVYPVKPQLTTYILPFGEDLANPNGQNCQDFQRVFVLIQATADNTSVKVDLNTGTWDNLYTNVNRATDPPVVGTARSTTINLNKGQTFLLDDYSAYGTDWTSTTTGVHLPAGTLIQANNTIQVMVVIGKQHSNCQGRGISMFPRGLWGTDYYAPENSAGITTSGTTTDGEEDIYLYNPWPSPITINYKTISGSGSFTIPLTSGGSNVVSFHEATGNYVPTDSGTYFHGSNDFWGVACSDTSGGDAAAINGQGNAYEWSYGLMPTNLTSDEYYTGWAPGSANPPTDPGADGIYLTPLQDNTTVYVKSADGTINTSYKLNALQPQYLYNPTTGDFSDTHIFATGPFCLAYGENAAMAPTGSPGMDIGYTCIPGVNFTKVVLAVHKTVSPSVVNTASGSTAQFTVNVDTDSYDVDGVSVVDTLPVGWAYQPGSTTITLADKNIITTDPTVTGNATSGYILTWPSSLLGSMDPNQVITITYTGKTTQSFSTGAVSQNNVVATGTRTVGGVTETFNTSDFAFVTYGVAGTDPTITKTSSVPSGTPLYPGNTATYTITVKNPSTGSALSDISIYDPLPNGVSYVSGSANVTVPYTAASKEVLDQFNNVTYSENDGTDNWAGSWYEVDSSGGKQNPKNGNVQVSGGELQMNGSYSSAQSIARAVDLSGMAKATLSFDWSAGYGINTGDTVNVQISTNGTGGPFTTIGTISGFYYSSSGSKSYDISSYISADTAVRFQIPAGSYSGNGEYFYADNVEIQASSPGSGPADDPPNLIPGSDGYSLAPGQTMTLTYSVSVDNPLPTGVNQIVNTASLTTDRFTTPLTASATNIVVNPTTSSASVGDRVWFDANGNGIQDVGETGLANVQVTLKDQFGATVAVTTTGTDGHYLFSGVTPGDGYYVEVTGGLPSGMVQSAPTGHSDNRTNSFNLTAGESYTGANLGYTTASGTATIGDRVFDDVNGNKIQDSGEPGIGGVTVQLWKDTNDDGVLDSGDTLSQSTVTASDGSYLFTGIPADPNPPSNNYNYFVVVDPTQSALTGYTPTTATTMKAIDLSIVPSTGNGEVLLGYDFGFTNTAATYSISDRVWFDANGNGVYDSGETGISGVTVDLLNASKDVIATTTTDANGDFTFTGVPGNDADYTISITDVNGVLSNYYGTTTAGIARQLPINNLTGNFDHTSTPDFGYNVSGGIGGTVFNDINGNGTQDSGEAGISGVTVQLYSSSTGSLIATQTTDAYGHYLFAGEPDGSYYVSIDTTQSALSAYGNLTTPDDNTSLAGTQLNVTITGGSSNLSLNFGYQTSTPRTVSGTLWNDTNQNGVIDSGETGIANVTIALLDSSGNTIATTTSDSNGNYAFNGLPPGIYTVKITDNNGVLTNYETTYEVTEGVGASSYNGEEVVDLTNGNVSDINFGYYMPTPTYVLISKFAAFGMSGHAVVEWQTASEVGTIGFDLLRLNPATGHYEKVNSRLVPAVMRPQGGEYAVVDPTAKVGNTYTYMVGERLFSGTERRYGPYKVTVSADSGIADPAVMTGISKDGYFRRAHQQNKTSSPLTASVNSLSARLIASQAMVAHAVSSASTASNAGSSRIKLVATAAGLYQIRAQDIANVLGISVSDAEKRIATGRMQLDYMGNIVPVLPFADNTGLYFYNQAVNSIYTDQAVYWLNLPPVDEKGDINGDGRVDATDAAIALDVLSGKPANGIRPDYAASGADVDGNGRIDMTELAYIADVISARKADMMGDVPSPTPQAANGNDFVDHQHFEKNVIDETDLFSNPNSDYWFWKVIIAGDPTLGTADIPITVNGVSSNSYTDEMTINFYGNSDTGVPDGHSVIVRLNGTEIGHGAWSGITPYTLKVDFDQSLLKEGDNTVEIEGTLNKGVMVNDFALNSIDLTYLRNYQAENDSLFFNSDTSQTVAITGFSSSDILLFDLSNPAHPKEVTHTVIDAAGSGYRLTFTPSGQNIPYLAVAADAVMTPDSMTVDTQTDLKSASNAANYLLIAPESLMAGAQTLADYRASRGLKTKVVSLTAIFDAFNYGMYNPHAIHDFIAYAYKNWATPPKYVVLVGDGSYDYKNYDGTGDNMVPVLMYGTPAGLFSSDNLYTDINGDNVPDIAIGRIPAVTNEQVDAVVQKIEKYEAGLTDTVRRVLMVADKPDEGGDFTSASNTVAALVNPADSVEKIYLSEMSASNASQTLINDIDSGAWLVNYFGHGGYNQISNEDIFNIGDVPLLTNTRYPIYIALTCLNGLFSVPGFDSLSEDMVLQSGKGFVAAWSPTGLSENDQALIIDKALFSAIYNNHAPDLGTAIEYALKQYHQTGKLSYLPLVYNLLGDPALKLR